MSDQNDGEDGSTRGGEKGEEAGAESNEGGGEAGGDEGTDDDTGGRASTAGNEPSGPQQLLDAVGEQIDEVRRRVDDQDASAPEEETFIEEGEADEGQPVDDTIAPPG